MKEISPLKLDLGVQRELPVLEWSVTEHALVGTCEQPEPARRVVFEAWADALQPTVRTEVPSGGTIRLTAFAGNYQGRGVNVAVVADVDEDTP